MSTTVDTVTKTTGRSRATLSLVVRRNTWTLGLIGILVLLLVVTKIIQPSYGPGGIQGLAISVLPLALAAVAQTCAVLARGIDLSIGSMMALTSVVSATLMAERSEGFAIVVVFGVLALGLLIGAVNGALVVFTRVPDIVVTLAMLFVWAGAALLVLNTPGGGSAQWLSTLTRGPLLSQWVPRAAVVLLVIVGIIWIPIRRSRLGISLYAVGSDPLAAFRSGVSVSRIKIFSYMLAGLFSAIAGLSLTATTGIGTPVPGPYTLMSVAAVVLGGVSLAGGTGGVFGPVVAVVILSLLRTDMTFLNVDTNLATVVQGLILVGVVMVGSLIQMRRRET
jgi:ribose transport system permease protein